MPDRIPTDDLYACLGLAADCDAADVDRAWRALLKRHHPDVAGTGSLEAAKRINVAHDWLSDATRRARYDTARAGAAMIHGRRHRYARGGPQPTARRRRPVASPPPPSPELVATFGAGAALVAAFLDLVRRLTADDLDRLAVSEPYLFAPRILHLLPEELVWRIDDLDARLQALIPADAWADAAVSGSARGFGHAIVLDVFLWLHLDDPDPLLDRMRRGWESSVGFPRYGPNTAEVAAFVARCARTTGPEASMLARAWRRTGLSDDPWPAAVVGDDYAPLEVSAALARRDAAAAARLSALGPRARLAARRALARSAHVLALRPIFDRAEFAAYNRLWEEAVQPGAAARSSAAGSTDRAAVPGPMPSLRRAPVQSRTSSSSRPTW